MGENRMSVPAGPSESTSRRGIVSQLTPRRIPVIYDAQDPALWRPPSEGSWEPFDVGLFADRGWRSCIAVPIVCGGRLIGALSAYSGSSAVVFEHLAGKLASAAAICADAILVYREDTVIAALAARYEEDLLTANVSLSALSLVHDVMHYYRTVQTNVTEAQGYLKTNQLAEAQRTLQDIEQTMTRTGPAINAMRKLATEARSSQSSREPQVTRDVPTVMAELEGLLRAILPHFARSKRLDPEMVTVEVEGPARPVSVPAMTLERIIVNLCVNSAQWNAAQSGSPGISSAPRMTSSLWSGTTVGVSDVRSATGCSIASSAAGKARASVCTSSRISRAGPEARYTSSPTITVMPTSSAAQ